MKEVKSMKKRVMSLFMTFALCAGLTVPAFAAGSTVTLPKLADDPNVKLTLTNVLNTYKIPMMMEKWDYEKDEPYYQEEEMTVYRLSNSGSYFKADSNSFFELFPGGIGFYSLNNGKFVIDPEVDYNGQMAYLGTYGRTSIEMVEENKSGIYGYDYGFNEGEYFYFTYADLSKYDVTPKPAAPVTPAAPAASGFTDVSASAYYAKAVKWAVENNVTAGTTPTTFSPDSTCTNAQILTFMWRAAGSPEPSAANPFSNLTGSEYYAKAAAWAYENGMVSGTSFDGNKPCTRAMTMEYFWKQAGSPAAAVSDKFTDVSAADSYAQAVAWAVDNGVTAGVSENTFVPSQTCTRGQIVTFLYRTLF